MERRDKAKKSAHLKELEEVFEKRTRRFSPFAVLGLASEQGPEVTKPEGPQASPVSLPAPESSNPDPGVGLPATPRGGSDPPTPGSTRPTPGSEGPMPGMGRPMPGMGRPTRVVVDYKYTTTKDVSRPTPGVGLPDTPRGGSDPPPPGCT
jgi:hypothetical protein